MAVAQYIAMQILAKPLGPLRISKIATLHLVVENLAPYSIVKTMQFHAGLWRYGRPANWHGGHAPKVEAGQK